MNLGHLARVGAFGIRCMYLVAAGAAVMLNLGAAPNRQSSQVPAGPQCGHWAVLRCCQLLGAPLDMTEILRLLPPAADGHNMLALAQALSRHK